ncbi:SCO family protein [Nocardioides sp. BP30]|uniref:SCO family protein n=1 Tax=Nocardioides sp. BP30 TaxID=3036374 RepID=UPI002468A071|nr:SCO family protein [Nocardioides sp. BP30]WGL53895.1 SCO family protein [Nocardioides sp. BP30]
MRSPLRRRGLAAALAVLALAVSACGSSGGGTKFAGITHDAYKVMPTALTDTDDQPYSLVTDTAKPLTLVFFGYTHCPDYCPMVMSNLASAMTRLDSADRKRVDVVFVTTDPSRDTTTVLRRYLDHYDKSFIGLTGPIDTIASIAEPMAVYVAQGQKLPDGGYDLNTHSTQVTAIGADNEARVLWTMDTSSAQYAADIHALLQKSA